MRLNFGKTNGELNYPDGIIYRTDYSVTKRNKQFNWIVTGSYNDQNEFVDGLDQYGDPINSAASIVYIVHAPKAGGDSTSMLTQGYLRFING